jgi:hypothetical protein
LSIGRLGKRNATESGTSGDQKPRSVQEQNFFLPSVAGHRLKMTSVIFPEAGARPLLERISLDGATLAVIGPFRHSRR